MVAMHPPFKHVTTCHAHFKTEVLCLVIINVRTTGKTPFIVK